MNAPCICPECGQAKPGRFGVVFNADLGTVSRGDKTAQLTGVEARLFACLWERFPRVQSKLDLWDWIYDSGRLGDPDWKVVDIRVCHIRKKVRGLEVSIRTVWGQGYALTFDPAEFFTPMPQVPWDGEQEAELRRRWKLGEPSAEIASAMGRTLFSVIGRRNKLGLTKKRASVYPGAA